ncbi:MAG: 50S ribosomal protein L10 [Actinomycetota bacterium]|nr:50S ribosomal protein L10 [Actinomycetota bacterium]
MPSTKKIERVAELKEQIDSSIALLLTEYRGLTVSEITELRKSLRDGGARFAVIKNTLMRRALEQTDAAGLGSLFDGPSAVAFVNEDPVTAAKSVTAASKKFPALVLKGGFVEGRVLSADEAKSLADLESREVMLSKLAGLMKGEMSRAAATFQAAQARFLSLLEAFKAKLPEEPAAEAAREDHVVPDTASQAATTSEAEPTSQEPAPEATQEAKLIEAGPEEAPQEGSDHGAEDEERSEPWRSRR